MQSPFGDKELTVICGTGDPMNDALWNVTGFVLVTLQVGDVVTMMCSPEASDDYRKYFFDRVKRIVEFGNGHPTMETVRCTEGTQLNFSDSTWTPKKVLVI